MAAKKCRKKKNTIGTVSKKWVTVTSIKKTFQEQDSLKFSQFSLIWQQQLLLSSLQQHRRCLDVSSPDPQTNGWNSLQSLQECLTLTRCLGRCILCLNDKLHPHLLGFFSLEPKSVVLQDFHQEWKHYRYLEAGGRLVSDR